MIDLFFSWTFWFWWSVLETSSFSLDNIEVGSHFSLLYVSSSSLASWSSLFKVANGTEILEYLCVLVIEIDCAGLSTELCLWHTTQYTNKRKESSHLWNCKWRVFISFFLTKISITKSSVTSLQSYYSDVHLPATWLKRTVLKPE